MALGAVGEVKVLVPVRRLGCPVPLVRDWLFVDVHLFTVACSIFSF